MSEKDEFDKILKDIEDKLDKNPELREEMGEHIKAIEDIFGHPIEVNVVYLKGVSEYMEVLDSYDEENFEISGTMTLGDFKDFLDKEEDNSFKIAIDPIHLKNGINEITNVLITSLDDKVIVVPITNSENDEK